MTLNIRLLVEFNGLTEEEARRKLYGIQTLVPELKTYSLYKEPEPPKPEVKPSVVKANGTKVRVASIDHDGLCGRDPHPEDRHVSLEGVVISNGAEFCGSGKTGGPYLAGHIFTKKETEDGMYLLYDVQLFNGERMWFGEHELDFLI